MKDSIIQNLVRHKYAHSKIISGSIGEQSVENDTVKEVDIFDTPIAAVYFDGEIDDETIDILLNKLDTALRSSPIVYLYFSSEGGIWGASKVLIDYLDTYKNRIVLVAYSALFSAALLIYYLATCEKRKLTDVLGLAHYPDRPYSSRELMNKTTVSSVLKKWSDEVFIDRFRKLYKAMGLSKAEIKLLDEGQDVVLNPDRMDILFPDIEE